MRHVPSSPARRRRAALAAAGLVVALAFTTTACEGSADDKADAGVGASRAADGGAGDHGKARIPADIAGRLMIGPVANTWLAGPRLGKEAEALYLDVSRAHGGR
ncbi:hypothetical protein [Streptomyces sp. NPDC015414]|uniref:hypothetical protein n=1 Tax=Streptomyces sp. NPDC015414 TaxID=3364957 RepID=UPI00370019DB